MKKIIFSIILIMFTVFGFAQRKLGGKSDVSKEDQELMDSIGQGGEKKWKKVKFEDTEITQYLIITPERDSTYLDTTLSIKKEYKYNYLRRDDFGLMPFANVGQTYNSLTHNFSDNNLLPKFGANAKHFNYLDAEDVNYYHVPTPLTEIYYKTAFTQGQQLDAFFTVNTSKRLNLSIAYKGMRSLGFYQNSLSSTGNLRMTASYKTKNNRYIANMHFTSQDILNEENGGITDESIEFFETGDEDFLDRGVFEVNFENAESLFLGKRFYLNHTYDIIKQNDSTQTNKLQVGHIMMLEDKIYKFEQSSSNDYFGEAFKTSNLVDRNEYERFYNQLRLDYTNKTIGNIQFNASHNNYNYGYNKVLYLDSGTIPNRIKGDILSVGGKYKKQYKGFLLSGEAQLNIVGDYDSNYLSAKAGYKLSENFDASVGINHHTVAPNFNTLLYQSDYVNYNWKNNFNNIKTQQIVFDIKSDKYVNLSLDFNTITDNVYFAKNEDDNVKPFQNSATITYLRAKLQKEIRYKNFALDNTVLYQNVSDENNTLNVPQIVTRNTLYYSNHVFKKAMFLQTGVIFNYFTKYNMNGYDPLLAEFYTQNQQEYGGFPRLDFFINAKIRQTRIFLKAEHFNAAFTGYNYYSAPNQPFRDFAVRFGLVWDFFM
ncbi:putative porin [Mesoflavibacter zeaxanthinifaciens]|uniref:putative porin n=1 Tax=Mesoflavibacter zeaxanthinifaciens TaxID=393060 RepID=UPI000415991E|nr:putative porin [Mesoflavibacter zeaxanthinifaciens]